jgi:hypothetical protein
MECMRVTEACGTDSQQREWRKMKATERQREKEIKGSKE